MSTSDDEGTTNPQNTVVTTVRLPQRPASAQGQQACIVFIYGDDLGRRIPLGARPVVIGRSSKADVRIDEDSVSRQHCRIRATPRGYLIEDLGSTNGTYVENQPVGNGVILRDGQRITIGSAIVKFLHGSNLELQYHEEIYRLMRTDGLTELFNRRYFDEALQKEVSRALRYGRPFSLVLFDIDHFKRINDTYGHLAGDAVLRQLGRLVSSHVRRDDVVARTGGEEFAVILPETGIDAARSFAEKLRQLVERTAFTFEETPIPVTISLGVAEWDPSLTDGKSLIQRADERLYGAKRSGRNRVAG